MKEQVLSIKQMQELIALGFDTSKASMCWFPMTLSDENNQPVTKSYFLGIHHKGCNLYWNTNDCREPVPTFTLQDILEIIKKKVLEKDLSLDLELNLINNQLQLTKEVDYRLYTSDGKTLLQSAFQMLKWCKQNHYM